MMKAVDHIWQVDPVKAWIFIILYWLVGWQVLLSRRTDSFHMTFDTNISSITSMAQLLQAPSTCWDLVVLFLTLGIQVYILNKRYSNFGRQNIMWNNLLFAIGNGIFETIIFLSVYDFGKSIILSSDNNNNEQPSMMIAIFFGYAFFFMYNAAIHAFFWMPFVFPHHVRPDSPPFARHGLPALVIMSSAWLLHYEYQHNVPMICFLHTAVDYSASRAMALPAPVYKHRHQH